MITKSVTFVLICDKTPCKLIVKDKNCVIKEITLNSYFSKICICTKSENLDFVANFNNITIYRTFCLDSKRSQNIPANFYFRKSHIRNKVELIILLNDENYGFPVRNGILQFEN